MSVTSGPRPDITPAQILSAIPVLSGLLAAFGVWEPTEEQRDALEMAILWGVALVFGDAGLRAARGFSTAKQQAVVLEEIKAAAPDLPSGLTPPRS